MSDEVEICNAAIDLLGGATISSLSENSKEARLCNRHYHRSRKYLLRAHPWGFAKKRQTLSRSTTIPLFGYDYQFSLPSDWVRNVEINGEREDAVDYKVEGSFVMFSATELDLLYIWDITDPQKFDASYTETLVHRMAYLMAYPLTQSRSIQSDMLGMFRQTFSEAKSIAAQDITDVDLPTPSKWLDARES